jgi:LAGLIDADG endonuclease
MTIILNEIKIFKCFLICRRLHTDNNKNNTFLGHYLAGLIEGDGSIIKAKTLRNEKGKLLYPRIKITFVDKDVPLANKIKQVINGGTIVKHVNSNYSDLLFQDLKTIQKVVLLINGKMRTPKIVALHNIIDWFNARSKEESVIFKFELDKSWLGNNPWLSGFLEADGNFFCSFDLNSKGIAKIVKAYMRIYQKQIYVTKDSLSNLEIMNDIKNFLGIKNVIIINRVKENYTESAYEIRTTKKDSCNLLRDYLLKYPLFSSKHQDFLDWLKFHNIRLSKQYKTIEGTQELIYIKNNMNTKRIKFNWEILEKFYS